MTEYSARNNDAPKIEMLPLTAIMGSRLNPRETFEDSALLELSKSIAQDGILQPIMVRRRTPKPHAISIAPANDAALLYGVIDDKGECVERVTGEEAAQARANQYSTCEYEIVMGESRWRAAGMAGLEVIPSIVREGLDDNTHLRLAIVENVKRRDLDPMELARAYRRLADTGMSQNEIAGDVHQSQEHVSNQMRLLDLPPDIQERIQRRELTVSHAKALLRYAVSPALASRIADAAVDQGLNTKQLEQGFGSLDWQSRESIEKAGVIVNLHHTHTKFKWQDICRKCPFKAFLPAGDYAGWCMKPDHFQELNKEAEREEKERKRKERQASTKSANGEKSVYPKLSSLKWNERELLAGKSSYEVIPDSCQMECGSVGVCPCRSNARKDDGELVAICIDPKQFVRRQKEAINQRKAAAHADLDPKLETVVDTLRADGLKAFDGRAAALIAWSHLKGANKNVVKKCLARHGVKLDVNAAASGAKLDQLKTAADLAQVEPMILIRMTVDLMVSREAALHIDTIGSWQSGDLTALNFLIGPEAEQAAALADDWTKAVPPDECAGCMEVVPFRDGRAWTLLENGVSLSDTGEMKTPQGGFYCAECGPGAVTCRECGCTDEFGCNPPCAWAEDDLCTGCVRPAETPALLDVDRTRLAFREPGPSPLPDVPVIRKSFLTPEEKAEMDDAAVLAAVLAAETAETEEAIHA